MPLDVIAIADIILFFLISYDFLFFSFFLFFFFLGVYLFLPILKLLYTGLAVQSIWC